MARDSYRKSHWGNTDDNEFGRSYHTEKKLHETYKAHQENTSSNINANNWDEVYGGLKTADLGYGKNPYPDAKFIVHTLNDKLSAGNQTLDIYSQKPIQEELDKIFATASNSIKPIAKTHKHCLYQTGSMPDMEGGLRIPDFFTLAGIDLSSIWIDGGTDYNSAHKKADPYYEKDFLSVDHTNNKIPSASYPYLSPSHKGTLRQGSTGVYDESKFITLYIKHKAIHNSHLTATGAGSGLYGGGGGGLGFVENTCLDPLNNAYQKAIGYTANAKFFGIAYDNYYRHYGGNISGNAQQLRHFFGSQSDANYRISPSTFSSVTTKEFMPTNDFPEYNSHLQGYNATTSTAYQNYIDLPSATYDDLPYTHTFIFINQTKHGSGGSEWYNKRIVVKQYLDGFNPVVYEDELFEFPNYKWRSDYRGVADQRLLDFRLLSNTTGYTQAASDSSTHSAKAQWESFGGSAVLNHGSMADFFPQTTSLEDFNVLNLNNPFHTVAVWDRGLLPEDMKAIMGMKHIQIPRPIPAEDSDSDSGYYYYAGGNGIGEGNI